MDKPIDQIGKSTTSSINQNSKYGAQWKRSQLGELLLLLLLLSGGVFFWTLYRDAVVVVVVVVVIAVVVVVLGGWLLNM